MLVAKAAHRAFRRKEGGVRKTHTGRDGCLLRKLARGAGARGISKLLVFFIKSKPDQVLGPGPWGRLRGPSRRLVPSWGYPGAGRPGPSAWGRASWPLRARSAAAEPPPRRIAVLARAVPALPVTPLLGRRLRAPAPRDAPNQTSVCLPVCLKLFPRPGLVTLLWLGQEHLIQPILCAPFPGWLPPPGPTR